MTHSRAATADSPVHTSHKRRHELPASQQDEAEGTGRKKRDLRTGQQSFITSSIVPKKHGCVWYGRSGAYLQHAIVELGMLSEQNREQMGMDRYEDSASCKELGQSSDYHLLLRTMSLLNMSWHVVSAFQSGPATEGRGQQQKPAVRGNEPIPRASCERQQGASATHAAHNTYPRA